MNKQMADSIITEFLQKIYGFAVKKSFDYEEAEDLSAEIVKNVYSSLLKSEEIYNIEGYIWRISEFTYSRFVSQKKKQEGISIDGIQIPYYEEFDSAETDEEIKVIRRELAFLTEIRRKIVYMFYYENKSIVSIAKTLNMPEGTVKWHLNKARNELKEGYTMERKIGKLGLKPIEVKMFGHSGNPGNNLGPESYLNDKLSQNIVYSVYHTPKTAVEIAEELGVTLVYIEDKISLLEDNGFIVKEKGDKYTTYVQFSPDTYSNELIEAQLKIQLEIADLLAEKYAPEVRKAVANMEVYIPDGNRELFEATAIFMGVATKCHFNTNCDLSKYYIKTTAGGEFIAKLEIEATCSDPDFIPSIKNDYFSTGFMTRGSIKYPIESWATDTRYCNRLGSWINNKYQDYEYLYELITGKIHDDEASADKFIRLKERKYITNDNKVNIVIAKGKFDDFYSKLPQLDENLIKKFRNKILEFATIIAKDYPPQMQELIINQTVYSFIGNRVAIMVMDNLYNSGVFKPLTENEKVTSLLIMFSDVLPE